LTGGKRTAANSSLKPFATSWIVSVATSFVNRCKNPHPESADLAGQGLTEWTNSLPEEDAEALVDNSAGTPVRWVPGVGWVEGHA
jgi:hypothetical protein